MEVTFCFGFAFSSSSVIDIKRKCFIIGALSFRIRLPIFLGCYMYEMSTSNETTQRCVKKFAGKINTASLQNTQKKLQICVKKMYIYAQKIYIWTQKMYILARKIYIFAQKICKNTKYTRKKTTRICKTYLKT